MRRALVIAAPLPTMVRGFAVEARFGKTEGRLDTALRFALGLDE